MKQLIIMPVHNAPEYTKKSLAALARTTNFNQSPLCIVDDASNEETQVILLKFKKAHPEIRLFRHHVNIGKPKAINSIMKLFPAAPYFTIVDNDVVIKSKNWTETLVRAHKVFKNRYILGAFTEEKGFSTTTHGFKVYDPYPFMNLAGRFFSIPQVVFKKLGFVYDEGFRHEDAEYCRRAAFCGFKWLYLRDIKASTFNRPMDKDRTALLHKDATEKQNAYNKRKDYVMETHNVHYKPKKFYTPIEIKI